MDITTERARDFEDPEGAEPSERPVEPERALRSSSARPAERSKPLHTLYTQLLPDARALAYLLTGDREEAHRLADLAFVRATGRFAHRIRGERFQVSLRRGVVALFLGRERRYGAEWEDGIGTGEDREAYGAGDGLWPALSSLPPRERAAVVLRFCRGLSDEDAARAIGCSVPTLRSLATRGIEALERASDEP
jgi:DNA-directed RNA polymerase specialized sigma24 family protein